MLNKATKWYRNLKGYFQWGAQRDNLKEEISAKDMEIEILELRIQELEEQKLDFASEQLRSYLRLGCTENLKQCEQLINTDEGLKHFGKMWGEYKVDTMMMLTAIEQEYIHNYEFNEGEIRTLRHFIGNVGLFFRGCKIAHEARVELQQEREKVLSKHNKP